MGNLLRYAQSRGLREKPGSNPDAAAPAPDERSGEADMDFVETALLAAGLSMDAFAVSVCKGLAMKHADLRGMLTCGVWFGGFQALMPLAGFWLGGMFADSIEMIDHYVAFSLLLLIGINMIREACSEEDDARDDDLGIKTMFLMAVATSVDALAVGVSLAMSRDVKIVPTVCAIGATTFCFSAAGVKIGSVFGSRWERGAQVTGGVILIVLGLRILLEHLGVIG